MNNYDKLALAAWELDAYQHLRRFVQNAKRTRKSFLVEDVREYAKSRGLPDEFDQRKWGGLVRAAKANGLIAKIGALPARSSNYSLKTLWVAL